MIFLIIGLSNIAMGLAYGGLGALSAWETINLHRYRGWSRFGIGFSLMAASCGPHHLVHGWQVLQGESVSLPMLLATLIGLPAGLVFVWLRIESVLGRTGERLVRVSPQRAILSAGGFAVVAGGLAVSVFAQPRSDLFEIVCTSAGLLKSGVAASEPIDFTSITVVSNLFVTVTYGMVGWFLGDHQVRRYLTSGRWSVSGLALTGVFFTCAQMHLVDAATAGRGLLLLFDLVGIPASVYFLWVVKQVHSDSVLDWNRPPLVGAAAVPARPSPWSGVTP